MVKAKKQFTSVWLFGSQAKDTATEESDIDLGIVFSDDVGFELEKEIFRMGLRINSKIEALSFSEQDFQKEASTIIHIIKKEGIRIA